MTLPHLILLGYSVVYRHRIKEEVLRCNYDPFEPEPNDGKSFRRRAYSEHV